ncbi:CRP-like cAMP-binding protein [Lacinutrix venerupis]|uniref:Cyclic nucleotide-binding domain-containing protein n=1 Tax=Lacinutrix venerupis TaxID=1486034 RepID=A0AAC9LN33_9FLAO|nr:Crp/Fnr family transcriptional regulator [Lacinutrix venerupis]APY00402.1 hypothetical protein BWR22_08750 [Lacinutrix venerupis]RLJ68768.1 CRP-like cAMP-binding protein [Lacinutrix venerupis]
MRTYYKEAHEYINSFQKLTEEEFDVLYNIAKLKTFKQGDKLLDYGTIPQKIYFITHGVVRSYVTLSSGKEVTTNLFNAFMFFAPFKALIKNEPNNLIYETLTESHVFEIDFKTFYNLCKKDLKLMTFYSKFLEYLVLKGGERFLEFTSNSAKERYLLLRERLPDLDNIIPQYQIAATIGITPVQLSRIRATL